MRPAARSARRQREVSVSPRVFERRRAALGFGAAFIFCATLEPRSNCFRLRTPSARTTLPLSIAVAFRLGAVVGAVRVRLRLFLFSANRCFAARFDDRVSDRVRDQLDRLDRVVVARNRNGDEIRIGVRIDERDDRNSQLVRLGYRDALLLGVDHEHQAGKTAQVLDAAQVLRKLVALTGHHQLLFLGVVLEIPALLGSRLELLQLADLLLHRLEVGEKTTEPPLRDVHRAGAVSFILHDVDELALGADEEDVLAAQDDIAREGLRHLQLTQRLLEIDDVDPVALREDETAHLRVPATGLVAEVNSGG